VDQTGNLTVESMVELGLYIRAAVQVEEALTRCTNVSRFKVDVPAMKKVELN